MKSFVAAGGAIALGVLIGCGGSPRTTAPQPAISIAEWNAMSLDEKYSDASLERLKAGDTKFQTEKGWEAFVVKTLRPHMKKDGVSQGP